MVNFRTSVLLYTLYEFFLITVILVSNSIAYFRILHLNSDEIPEGSQLIS